MTEKRFYISCDSSQNIYDDALKCYYSSIDAKKLCKLLNKLNEENNALKSDRYRFEEEAKLFALSELNRDNEKIKDLILDAIVEMHDGKRDYAEKLLNEAIELIE